MITGSGQHIVVLSGAGISAESGLKTFRDSGGLWEGHRVEDVATPEAWERNPQRVLDFYNMRRRQLKTVEPNAAHRALAKMETNHKVSVITQNVDDLHERAGSSSVLHLHGQLDFARSSVDPSLIYPLDGKDIELGQTCSLGSQLRPHIVWFGEMVPEIENAMRLVLRADVLLVVGTSLAVYPAASLAYLAPGRARKILVNPDPSPQADDHGFEVIAATATVALPEIVKRLSGRDT